MSDPRNELIRTLGVARSCLQVMGHYGRVQNLIDELFAANLVRAVPASAKALRQRLSRPSDGERKSYLRATIADLGAEVPIDRMVEVFVDAGVLRNRLAHAAWTDLLLGSDEKEPAVFIDTVTGGTTQQPFPLSSIEGTARRLEWLISWLETVQASNPLLADPNDPRDVARRAMTWVTSDTREPPPRIKFPALWEPPEEDEAHDTMGRMLRS